MKELFSVRGGGQAGRDWTKASCKSKLDLAHRPPEGPNLASIRKADM